jgi:uncharacterized membrane protein YraQ (UPF0718 family)
MYWLYLLTGILLGISLISSREKTFQALKISCLRFKGIAPAFVLMIVLVSITLFLVPDALISAYLGVDNKTTGLLWASLMGSITLMPGFIAFPLAGLLLKKGVAYMVLSAFTTTLMMVGVLTFPIEKQYFGTKVTIVRNVISLMIALIIAVATGFFFGEVLP